MAGSGCSKWDPWRCMQTAHHLAGQRADWLPDACCPSGISIASGAGFRVESREAARVRQGLPARLDQHRRKRGREDHDIRASATVPAHIHRVMANVHRPCRSRGPSPLCDSTPQDPAQPAGHPPSVLYLKYALPGVGAESKAGMDRPLYLLRLAEALNLGVTESC